MLPNQCNLSLSIQTFWVYPSKHSSFTFRYYVFVGGTVSSHVYWYIEQSSFFRLIFWQHCQVFTTSRLAFQYNVDSFEIQSYKETLLQHTQKPWAFKHSSTELFTIAFFRQFCNSTFFMLFILLYFYLLFLIEFHQSIV